MPCIAVACGYVLGALAAAIDSEVEGDHAVATYLVLLQESWFIRRGGIGAVMPSIAIACSYILVASTAAVDSEVEGDNAIATDGIGSSECRFGSA